MWKLFPRKPIARRRSRQTFKPTVEWLEDRCVPAVIQVGPGDAITTIAQAASVAQAGDTIEIQEAAAYTGQEAIFTQNNLTIEGVGGTPIFNDSGYVIQNQKGIFDIKGNNVTVSNIECEYAHDTTGVSNNYAGIRGEGNTLTIQNCTFLYNDDGILINNDPNRATDNNDLLVSNCEFGFNGYGDGESHNMYIGEISSFTLQYSYSHDANQGHDVKSRALNTYLLYNYISDGSTGGGSSEVDIPWGGNTYLVGNVIEKDANAANHLFLTYDAEQPTNPGGYSQQLYIVNNTFVNDYGGGTYIDANTSNLPATLLLQNNIFAGGGTLANVAATETTNLAASNPGFVSWTPGTSGGNYYLTAGSAAINAGTQPATVNGFSLVPTEEYVAPLSNQARPVVGTIDIGAYEYTPPAPAAPTNLTATAGNAQIALTWTASSGAASYDIYRGTSSGGETLLQSGITTASFTDTGLTNGTTYYYEVSAVNAGGQSGNSNEVSTTPASATINVTPSNYLTLVPTAKAGDTVIFAAGSYTSGLNLSNMNGAAGTPITFNGSAGAVILGTASQNTVELDDTSYLVFENFTVNSQNNNDAIKAGGSLTNVSHDIVIKDNTILNAENPSDPQQTDGISTKCIAWNWTIEGNTIQNAGTGLYLGNSDGSAPFINGIIENNTVEDTIGYGMEIKDQNPYSLVSGMPAGPNTTIIRNNTFDNNDLQTTINGVAPDGARPSVMIGGFPASGPGSSDMYQVYGNILANNANEALLQVTGRASIHDNIFVNSTTRAIAVQPHTLSDGNVYNPQYIPIYDNTIYDAPDGIDVAGATATQVPITGNLIFAPTPINGITPSGNNLSDTVANAGLYVVNPSTTVASMNFALLPGKGQGTAVNLSQFSTDLAYNLDFAGTVRPASDTSYGAYEGTAVAPPAAPANLAATAGNAQVALTWTISSGASSYDIYRGTSSGGETLLKAGVTGTSYTDAGLTNGTTYFYEVSAVNAGGQSGKSNEVSATPQVAAPAAPTNLAATAGNAQVALTWTASSGASSYYIYRGTSSGGETLLKAGVTGTSYTDAGLTNGTTYFYEVSAVNAGGQSGKSNEVSATPQVAAPAAPTNLAATAGNAQVALTWTASSGASSYYIYRGTSSGGETLLKAGVTGTSYTDAGLTNGTTYFYEVSAVNAGGQSGKSNEVSATPQVAAPAAPTNLAATAGNAQVALTWTASSGASSYDIYRGTSSGGETLLKAGVTGTSYTDAGLTNGTTYFYEVSAVNAGGQSGKSNQVSAIPASPVVLTPTTLPGGTVGVAYSQQIKATGGSGAGFTYKVTAGHLPSGLTLNLHSGNLAGTPTNSTGSPFAFTVTATDSQGHAGHRAYSLTVASPLGTSANAIYVENTYGVLLHRAADPGASVWVNFLSNGGSPSSMVKAIEGSTEYLTDVVAGIYQHYLHRAPDAGAAAWVNLLAQGTSIERVIASIAGSGEYLALHGGTNAGFVQALYQDILGRPADSAGLKASGLLNTGVAARYQVALDFLTSKEYYTDMVESDYKNYLGRTADAGGLASWVQALQAGTSDQTVLAAIFGSAEAFAKWS